MGQPYTSMSHHRWALTAIPRPASFLTWANSTFIEGPHLHNNVSQQDSKEDEDLDSGVDELSPWSVTEHEHSQKPPPPNVPHMSPAHLDLKNGHSPPEHRRLHPTFKATQGHRGAQNPPLQMVIQSCVPFSAHR